MTNEDTTQQKKSSPLKNWLIGGMMIVIVTICMLLFAEVGMRWIDGFQLSNFELNQTEQTEETK